MKSIIASIIILFIFSVNAGAVVHEGYDQQGPAEDAMWVPGVLIVSFAPQIEINSIKSVNGRISTGSLDLDNILLRNNVQNIEKLFATAKPSLTAGAGQDLSRYHRIEFPPQIGLDNFMAELSELPGIESVEPVGIHPVMVTPNDNSYSSQWHHYRSNDHDIDSPEAWDVETGDSSVIVAIVDTGVLWDHPDLGGGAPHTDGNIWINWAEYNGTSGVDDDDNGYIDDFRGWDWVSVSGAWSGEDASTPDNDPTDFNGHGTHCAGIVAAITNNSLGVAGVAGGFYPSQEGAKIMALRVGWSAPHPTYGYETGYVRMDFCAQAFYYAVDNGADVISCSWGSSNSGGMGAALNYAVQNGVVVCKAAGNESSNSADYLCSQSSVVSVASTTSSGTKSSFSNYGSWVDISAPGSSIYSTYSNHGAPSFASLSGTSMASPMAAGLAALIKSRDTSLSKADIENIMFNSADNIDSYNPGYIGQLGAGRINAFNAVTQLVYATFEASPRLGKPPLEVQFSAESPFQVDEWKYHFGDGDSSLLQNPVHIYDLPGVYTVTQMISTPLGESSQTLDSFIVVLADTLSPTAFIGPPAPGAIEIPISLKNVAPIDEMIIPVTFGGELDLVYDSFSVAGTRTQYFEKKQLLLYNNLYKALVFKLAANDGGGSYPLGAGDGEILKIYFHPGSLVEGVISLDTISVSGYTLNFSTPVGDYVPEYAASEIRISDDDRGDANGDEIVNVSDAVHIINYIFIPGSPSPVSQCGGDANNDGIWNVSDAIFLINYIFVEGSPEPDPCY